jgi:hypothetical protein
MPIPKDSNLRLPTYVTYYLILSLVFALLFLSLFVRLPLAPNQFFLLFLADVGGYGVIEEITKAKGYSFVRKHQSVLIVASISVIVAATVVLLSVGLDSILAVGLLTTLDVAVWGSLWAARKVSKKKEQKPCLMHLNTLTVVNH